MAAGLREETRLPGYLFYGEEEYLAEEFLGELQAFLAASSGGDVRLARMSLDETDWPDIIDAARTAPFLFEPWRAIVVRVPERKPASERPAARDGGEGPAPRHLGPAGQKLLREYFADRRLWVIEADLPSATLAPLASTAELPPPVPVQR